MRTTKLLAGSLLLVGSVLAVCVSLVFPPPAGDAKTVSIAIAEHVLA